MELSTISEFKIVRKNPSGCCLCLDLNGEGNKICFECRTIKCFECFGISRTCVVEGCKRTICSKCCTDEFKYVCADHWSTSNQDYPCCGTDGCAEYVCLENGNTFCDEKDCTRLLCKKHAKAACSSCGFSGCAEHEAGQAFSCYCGETWYCPKCVSTVHNLTRICIRHNQPLCTTEVGCFLNSSNPDLCNSCVAKKPLY